MVANTNGCASPVVTDGLYYTYRK